jgi:replication initiation and membrane attachment protein
MKEVSPSDIFEVRPLSLLGGLDQNYLVDLYEPLIGAMGFSLYETLVSYANGELYRHDDAFMHTGLTNGQWQDTLSALEAVGLVRTYRQAGDKFVMFVYCLYAPKTPGEFFDNALFAGTLLKYVGKDQYERLAKKYSVQSSPKDFEDVSETFSAYFNPDFSDPSYASSIRIAGTRLSGREKTIFDRNVFLSALHAIDNRYNSLAFGKEEFLKIERLSTLYSYDESTMADFVNDHYSFSRSLGNRLDYRSLASDCADGVHLSYLHPTAPKKETKVEGDGSFSKVIKEMENLTPVQFLCLLQKGNKPAKADLDLLTELTVEMGLAPSVCNALVFYILTKNDNVLSRKLTEKVAASLVREGVENALDAMNYFTKTGKGKIPAKPAPKIEETPREKPSKGLI